LRAPARAPLFRCRLVVEDVDDAARVLTVRGQFPFGLQIRNRLSVTPVDAQTARVQFG
jgi:hypothetical protein